jgi:membrane protease subunit HflK
MARFSGWISRGAGAAMNENKGGPWGPSDGDGDGGGGDGPRSPWGQPPRKRRPGVSGPNIASFDDFLKKSRERFGGRFPQSDGRPYWLYGLGIVVLVWLLFTSFHRIGAQEEGVVTLFCPGRSSSWSGSTSARSGRPTSARPTRATRI